MHPIAERIAARRTAATAADIWHAQFPAVRRSIQNLEEKMGWVVDDAEEAAHMRRRPNPQGIEKDSAQKLHDIVKGLAELQAAVAQVVRIAADMQHKLDSAGS